MHLVPDKIGIKKPSAYITFSEPVRTLGMTLTLNFNTIKYVVRLTLRKSFTVKLFYCRINLFICRYETVEKRLNKTITEREDKVNKERELRLFFETLENKPQLIDTWDENLWITLVEKMEASHDKMCTVFFKNGVSVNVNI